jgi:hypothetical protein
VMRARFLLGLGVPVAALVACAGQTDRQVLPPEVLAMLDTMPPTYDDGLAQLYQVGKEVRLPMRAPRQAERPQGLVDPYPRPPFHLVSDTRISLRFTLSNLDDRRSVVELLIDPWNEFVRYHPGVVQRDGEIRPNASGIQRSFVLGPLERVEGIITADDIAELATDLATAMELARNPPADEAYGGPMLYNRAFDVQNHSSEPDPVLAPYQPAAVSGGVVAGVIGFDLGLRTASPARVAVEAVIDIEDINGDRVVREGAQGDDARRLGRPDDELSPPAFPGAELPRGG